MPCFAVETHLDRLFAAPSAVTLDGALTVDPADEAALPYQKALKKRLVWVEPLFAEAK